MNLSMSKFEDKAELLKILGHPVRLEILDFLRKGPACATKTNKAIDIPQPNLSQHLRILRDAKLVDCCIDGQRRCYSIICPSLIFEMLDLLRKDHELTPCDNKHSSTTI